MRISVLLFARAREVVGERCEVEVPADATAGQLLAALSARPELATLVAGARLAVNRRFAAPETRLHEADEVALIPPVGGG